MEILINELSLTGQFDSTEQFLTDALWPFLKVMKEIDPEINTIYKKQDLWNYRVTTTDTLHDVLLQRTDEARRLKSLMSCLLAEPYWESSQKHSPDYNYNCNNTNVCGQSIAEACERDRIVVSFTHPDFSARQLYVSKAGTVRSIIIDNLFDESHYIAVAKKRGITVPFSLKDTARFTKTSRIEQGQPVYMEKITNYYWYKDNLHKTHYEVFNSEGLHVGEADLGGNIDKSKRDTSKTVDYSST
ncbi:MAG: hypothetical protein LBD52_04600 [Prevotellaceae bacterium]|jgi:hypothetical protein|nr:hypothetical protein [Prevotellaceae bacterium]